MRWPLLAGKIGAEVVLNLENEGFETATQSQRLDVIAEVMCFLIQVVDRLSHDRQSDQQRQEFVIAFALALGNIMLDNRYDVEGDGPHKEDFIALVNERGEAYSQCSFSVEDGAGFPMRRMLGEYVRQRMGDKDNKWIPDYVMDIEAPKAVSTLKRAMPSLFMS